MRWPSNKRGSVIIHVALALVALLALSTFVLDQGLMYVARRQAQNAADAGALAGAISMMKDPGNAVLAAQSARHFAGRSNAVWGSQTSDVHIDVSPVPMACPADVGGGDGCIRVDVLRGTPNRNGTQHTNYLPSLMGHLLGMNSQGVRATATAQVGAGNLVRCLLPFAVADRWADNTDHQVQTFPNDGLSGSAGWSPNDFYEGTFQAPPGTDSYTPPYAPGHTGWTVAGDYGRQLVLKDGGTGQFSAGWANTVDLPGSTGANSYRSDIKGCHTAEIGIATQNETCAGYPGATTLVGAKAGCLGVSTGLMVGPTRQGITGGGPPTGPSVVQQDPNARWSWGVNAGPNQQAGGVVDASGNLNMSSARIRPVAVFDITRYMQNPLCRNGGTGCIAKVVNIIGFFVEGMCDDVRTAGRLDPGMACDPKSNVAANEVVGRIVTLPASFATGGGQVTNNSSFLQIVRLVR